MVRALTAGLAATGLVVAVLASACSSSTVDLPVPMPTNAADASACQAFLGALPDTVGGYDRRDLSDAGASGAAYGDPAVVITCGTTPPTTVRDDDHCDGVDGVDWYSTNATYSDQTVPATVSAVGYTPLVQVTIPAKYRPAGVAAVLLDLAAPIKATLSTTTGC